MTNRYLCIVLGLFVLFSIPGGCRNDSFKELDRRVQVDRFKKSVRSDLKRMKKVSSRRIEEVEKRLKKQEKTISRLTEKHRNLNKRLEKLRSRLQERLLTSREIDREPGSPTSVREREENDRSSSSTGRSSEIPRDNGSGSSSQNGKEALSEEKRTLALQARVWRRLGSQNLEVEALAKEVKPYVDKVSEKIVDAISDSKLTRRKNAEELMVEIGAEPFRERLLTSLENGQKNLRLIRVIGRLHLSKARSRLLELKKSTDPDTRYFATRALVQIGDHSAVPDLIDYLSAGRGSSLYPSEGQGKPVNSRASRTGEKVSGGRASEPNADDLYKMDAHRVLKNVMNRDFGHPSAVVATREQNRRKEVDWKNWWNAYSSKVKWNPDAQHYRLKPEAVSPITVEPRNER